MNETQEYLLDILEDKNMYKDGVTNDKVTN